MRTLHYFDVQQESLLVCYPRPLLFVLFFFFFVKPEHFLFVPSGPFFTGLHRLRSKVSKRFYSGTGEKRVEGRRRGLPPPGPSLARTFTLARCAAGAPQVTKFRELRDFYGCPPKVEPGVSRESLGRR